MPRSAALPVALALALVVTACGSEPEVELSTRVGEATPLPSAPDLVAERVAAYQSWIGAMPRLGIDAPEGEADTLASGTPAAKVPRKKSEKRAERKKSSAAAPDRSTIARAADVPLPPPHPPRDASELAATVDALRRGPLVDVAIPARNLAESGPELWTPLRELLLAERKGRKADYKALLDRIGGDVPNRYGHFERAWKRAHGFKDIALSEDWYGDLLALPPSRVGKALDGIYRECVLTAALLQAAPRIARDRPDLAGEVVATLLDLAYAHEGTYRDEVGRAIRAIGDEAVPHLVRASLRPPAKDEEERYAIPYRRAEYAELQLDRLDRLQPKRAAQALADDPRRLAELMAAYAERRPEDAVEVLLDHVDAPIPRVRRAARAAFLAYVSGPPPAIERKTLRLLGGKTSQVKARPSYRESAQAAIRSRLAGASPGRLEEPCRLHLEDGTRDAACEAQPERHTLAYFEHLDHDERTREESAVAAALALADLDATVAELDRLLVQNPEMVIDARIVDAYQRAADAALAASEHGRAGQLLRKEAILLATLDPARSEALTVQALLAEASVPELPPEGRTMLLSTAEALAPEGDAVAATVAAARASRPRAAELRWGALALRWGLLAAALALLGGIGARLRRRAPLVRA